MDISEDSIEIIKETDSGMREISPKGNFHQKAIFSKGNFHQKGNFTKNFWQ